MLTVVIVLYSLGGVLPIAGIIQAALAARGRFNELDADLQRIDAIGYEAGADEDLDVTLKRIHAVRKPGASTWYSIEYAPDIAERNLYRDLRRPALFAVVGILAGTVGSLLSLTL